MIIKRERELTFNDFFLLEFFNQILEKGKEMIAEDKYETLHSLGDYMTREADVFPALEKLARLQGTNELSIFLFDMVGRIEDYASDMIFATLPDLADDFINLYSLLIEESGSTEDLKTIISEFEKEYGASVPQKDKTIEKPQEKETVSQKKEEVAAKELSKKEIKEKTPPSDLVKEKPAAKKKSLLPEKNKWIKFVDFYDREYKKILEDKLLENMKAADAKKIVKLIWGLNDLRHGITNEDLSAYKTSVLPLFDAIEKLDLTKADKAGNINQTLDLAANIEKVASVYSKFVKVDPDLSADLLKNGVSDENLRAVEKPKTLAPEEVPEKPVTIDNLLLDYFKSEVEDHLEQIQAFIKEDAFLKQSESSHKKLSKHFRSLKEISMIHGYNGMEYGVSMIIAKLDRGMEAGRFVAKKSIAPIKKILKELSYIEKYTDSPKDDPQIEKLKKLIEKVEESFESLDREEVEPVSKPAEVEAGLEEIKPEEAFSFSDSEKIKNALRDILSKLNKQLAAEQARLRNNDTRSAFTQKINYISNALRSFFPEISKNLLDELVVAYQYIFNQTKKLQGRFFENLESIWAEFFEVFDNDGDMTEIAAAFKKLCGEENEELIGVKDLDIGPVFADTHRLMFDRIENKLESAFVQKDEIAVKDVSGYMQKILTNLSLIGYENYQPAIQYLIDFLGDDSQIQKSDLIKGFIFDFLHRIKTKGRAGNADDLLDKLKQALFPDELEVKDSEEEDVEDIFKKEFSQYLAEANEALAAFKSDISNRNMLKKLEQAVHSINTACQILNKTNISRLILPIEDVAELYGQSTIPIPSDLPKKIQRGLNDLKKLQKNEDYDADETIEILEQVLDQIMIEDIQPVTTGKEIDQPLTEVEKEEDKIIEKEEVDQELVDIFEEEAKTYLKILHEENKSLGVLPIDEESLNKLESSAHSLRAAAKMMGFRDIATLSGKIEETIVDVKREKILPSENIVNTIKKSLSAIETMSSGVKLSSAELDKMLSSFKIDDSALPLTGSVVPEAHAAKSKDELDIDKYYYEEAVQIISLLNEDMVGLEKMPESETPLSNILRNLHTLKGSSMMVKLEKIGALCHKLEDYFELYKEQSIASKENMMGSAFQVVDLIEEFVNKIKNGGVEESSKYTGVLAEIDNKLFLLQNLGQDKGKAPLETKPQYQRPIPVKASKEDENFLKVTTSYIDNLVNMATDLVVNRTELSSEYSKFRGMVGELESGKKQIYQTGNMLDGILEQDLDSVAGQESNARSPEAVQDLSANFRKLVRKVNDVFSDLEKLSRNFEKNIERITNLSNSLHSNILRVRMIPVEFLFDRFSRPIRDLAHSIGKKVTLNFEGSDTEMDRAMVEALVDPILHIVRNAVDHGIESDSERKKLKKNPIGQITLRARRDKNQVVIEVQDDGRGVDIDRVKKEIIKRKLEQKKVVNKLSEAEILEFLFYPKFSTADKVNKVSGRGIGMDVVTSQIKKLKGNIRINTKKNEGTAFSIRLPLTLVISQTMMTKCQGQAIAIPASAVQDSVSIDSGKIINDDDKQYIKVRDKLLPYVNLDDVLIFSGDAKKDEVHTAVVIYDAGVSVAVGVPGIEGRQEIVIKALGSHLQNVEYISGGTILGNGEVALILDYAAIIRTVEMQFFGDQKNLSAKQPIDADDSVMNETFKKEGRDKKQIKRAPIEIEGRKAVILVVDDSVSARNFVGSILEKVGFETRTAESGNDAMQILKINEVDLIITDLEMPNMDGFSLISNLRAEEKYDSIPIVILTGKSGDKQQKEGVKRGADAFIAKPFKEDELVKIIKKHIIVK